MYCSFGKMHKSVLHMLCYPLLAQFEHVRDIHCAAYQYLSLSLSLSLSLFKATHSEAVRASAERVNAEPPTAKKHQSCRECLNISEGKNEDGQSEPEFKWQVERTPVAVKSCSVGAMTLADKQLRMQPKVRRSIALIGLRLASTQTAARSLDTIKQNQTRSREIKA